MHDLTLYQGANKQATSVVQAVKEYGKRLSGFVRAKVRTDEDAEDIMQEVWYQLSGIGEETEIESLSGWLYRVARHKIIDLYRRKTTEPLDSMIGDDEQDGFDIGGILYADTATPETEYLRDIFREELFAALDELPEAQRQVYVWNELEDMTLQQIADRTGDHLKTVISRKGYAVKHLRKRLETLYKEYTDC
jgi:RNA polymerase sigma factor (sigma-70 family)